MIWFLRIFFVLCYMVCYDALLGLVGLIFSRFRYADHPRLHRFGLRRLAMCLLFGSKFLPDACQLDCGSDKCGNWTCPYYSKHGK